MADLRILCEGQTEVRFTNGTLLHHLRGRGVHTKAINLLGGLSWEKILREVNLALGERRPHVFVTTFIDLYKVVQVRGAPDFGHLAGVKRAEALEAAMGRSCPNCNVLHYVQVHEFEALVFVDLQELLAQFPDGEALGAPARLRAETANLSPEEINEGEQTAPSKRLIRAIRGYEVQKAIA